jgi:membrane protein DedA with SNARE-associated domain
VDFGWLGDVVNAIGGAVDWFAGFLNGALSWILDTVQDVHPAVRTLLAGFGILLETSILIGLVIPGDTIVIVASTAVDSPAQFVALMVAVIVGALCGESIGFALGRYFGPKIRASRLGRRVGEKNWVRAENYLDRRGGIAVFISRFLPVLHSLIPLTVGMSTMSYRRFIAWTLPACVIWTTAYVSVGTFAAGSFRDLLDQLHYAGYIFAGILVLFVIATLVAKKLLERSAEKDMLLPGDGDANTPG